METEFNPAPQTFWQRQCSLDNKLLPVIMTAMSIVIFVFGCMQLCGHNLPLSPQAFMGMALAFSATTLLYYSLRSQFDKTKTTRNEIATFAVTAAIVMSLAITALTGKIDIHQASIGIVAVNAFFWGAVILHLAVERGKKIGYDDGYNQARLDFYRGQNSLREPF